MKVYICTVAQSYNIVTCLGNIAVLTANGLGQVDVVTSHGHDLTPIVAVGGIKSGSFDDVALLCLRQRAYTELVGYRLTVLLGKKTAAVDVFQFLHADALHTGMGDYLFTAYMGSSLDLQFIKDGLYLHI